MTISEYHQEVGRALQARIDAGKVTSYTLSAGVVAHWEKIGKRQFITIEIPVLNDKGVIERRYHEFGS